MAWKFNPFTGRFDYFEAGAEVEETDPVFSAWNKSDGISITESQISDFGTYLTAETDPDFNTWLSTTPPAYPGDIPDVSGFITDIAGQDLSTADNTTSAFITAGDIPAIPADVSDLTDTTGIIPTNTNELTNGAGFITAGDIPAIPDSVDDLAPSQSGNSGKYLKTDGTNATWETGGGGGGDFLVMQVFS